MAHSSPSISPLTMPQDAHVANRTGDIPELRLDTTQRVRPQGELPLAHIRGNSRANVERAVNRSSRSSSSSEASNGSQPDAATQVEAPRDPVQQLHALQTQRAKAWIAAAVAELVSLGIFATGVGIPIAFDGNPLSMIAIIGVVAGFLGIVGSPLIGVALSPTGREIEMLRNEVANLHAQEAELRHVVN